MATKEPQSESQPRPDRSSFWACVGCGLALLLLALQQPFALGGPDSSYHSAKIARAQEGIFFEDPYSGTLTAYPALFHVVFGSANRLLGANPYVLQKLIELLQFSGLLLGFYFFAKSVIRSSAVLACSVLALSLVVYAPTGRYILGLESANFSFGLMFLGLGLLNRYQLGGRAWLLAGGGLSLGAASAIWWNHVFVLPVFLVLLSARPAAGRPWRVLARVAAGCFFFALPCLCVVWQLWSIRSVLPAYHSVRETWNIPGAIWMWLSSLATLGNAQFFHYFSPFEACASFGDNPAMGVFRLARALFLSAQFFLLIIPFNVFLLVSSLCFYRGLCKAPADDRARLIKRLLGAAALGALLLVVLAVASDSDLGKLRRCQFVIFAVLLAVGMEGAWGSCREAARRPMFKCIFWCAFASLLLTAMYSPKSVAAGLAAVRSEENQSLFRFIANLPDHRHERIFFCSESLRQVAPYVSFRGFVGHISGGYYHQDAISARKMLEAYLQIVKMEAGWKEAARSCGVRYMALSKERDAERELISFYKAKGETVLENNKWIVLRIRA